MSRTLKSYSLFDLLLASSQKKVNVSKAILNTKTSVSAASNQGSLKRYTDNAKKKKKKLSSLKKRILQERLTRFQKNHEIKPEVTPPSTKMSNFDDAPVVIIKRFLHEDIDEDEKLETIQDMNDLLSPFGLPASIHFGFDEDDIAIKYLCERDDIIAVLPDWFSAQAAVAGLNGIIVGGQSLQVLLGAEHFTNRSLQKDPPCCGDAVDTELCGNRMKPMNEKVAIRPKCSVFLKFIGLISSDDDFSDPDELNEVLNDLITLCEDSGHRPVKGWIRQERCQLDQCLPRENVSTVYENVSTVIAPAQMHSSESDLSAQTQSSESDLSASTTQIHSSDSDLSASTHSTAQAVACPGNYISSGLPWGVVYFSSAQMAINAIKALSGKTVAGQLLQVRLLMLDFATVYYAIYCTIL